MLKYLVYCDFATLKCDFKQFAAFLNGYTDDFENLNNAVWLVSIDDSESPIHNDLSNLPQDLESAGYATKDSIIVCARYSSLVQRFSGIDESVHVD